MQPQSLHIALYSSGGFALISVHALAVISSVQVHHGASALISVTDMESPDDKGRVVDLPEARARMPCAFETSAIGYQRSLARSTALSLSLASPARFWAYSLLFRRRSSIL
jgi:hypothetical protein